MSAGVPLFPQFSFQPLLAGLATDFGTWTGTNARVTYVCNATSTWNDFQPLAQRALPTLDAALKECRSGCGDTVVLLPGHAENFTDNTVLASLVAGTRIIGIGNGSARPKLRLTNTAGSILANKNDVVFRNIRFALEGANGITKGIVVTGADVLFDSCEFEVASGATAKAAIALEIGSGGDRCRITNSLFRGTATHNVTDGIKVIAAVNDVSIIGNQMVFSATAANGNIHFTAAALSSVVHGNLMVNTHTASSACLVYDDVAVTGIASYNVFSVLNNGTAASQGVTFGTAALIRAFQNFCSDEPQKSGVLAPGAAT